MNKWEIVYYATNGVYYEWQTEDLPIFHASGLVTFTDSVTKKLVHFQGNYIIREI